MATTTTYTSPWIGLTSYTEDLKASFHGRQSEIDQMVALVERRPVSVLYGVSGLGKSSLLRAGVFPVVRERDVLPVWIRLPHELEAADLVDAVLQEVARAAKAADVEAPAFDPELSLWENFHRKEARFWNARHFVVTPLLVFDQFEEAFTLGQENAARRQRFTAFIEQLSDLLENRVPVTAQQRLQAGAPTDYDFEPVPVRALFSLREDFLAPFNQLVGALPDVAHNRFRLEAFSTEQARVVLHQGGSADALLGPGFEEAVLSFLSTGGKESGILRFTLLGSILAQKENTGRLELNGSIAEVIDPAYLSVILHELDLERQQQGLQQLTLGLLQETHGRILEGFYERALNDQPIAVRTFIEDELLTPNGYRGSRSVDEALAQPGVTMPMLRALVEQRLLRFEDRAHGGQRVEITHDLLCPVVLRSKERRIFLRRRRKRRVAWTVAAVVLLFAAFSAWRLFAQLQKERAINDSAKLVKQAMELLQTDPLSAYLVAERAFALNPGLDAERALVCTYPFMYPEKARFRGNGYINMPYSKVFLIIDSDHGDVSCMDYQGKKQWNWHTEDHMGRVTAFDSAGLIFIPSEKASLLDIEGKLLYTFKGKYKDYEVRSRSVVIVGNKELVTATVGGHVVAVEMDTIGQHKSLASASSFAYDDSLRYISVADPNGVHVFDLRDSLASELGYWASPEPLTTTLFNVGSYELVATGHQKLYQLHLSSKGDFAPAIIFDLAPYGIDPSKDSEYARGKGALVFHNKRHLLVDLSRHEVHVLGGIGPDDMIETFDPTQKCFTFSRSMSWKSGHGEGGGLFRFDGTPIRTWDDATISYREDCITELTRSGGDAGWNLVRTDLRGDTLSIIPLLTQHNQEPESWSNNGKRGALTYWQVSEFASPGRICTIMNYSDPLRPIRRMFLPAQTSSAILLTKEKNELLVCRADSLIALVTADVDGPFISDRATVPDCCGDSLIASSPIVRDALDFTLWQEDGSIKRLRINLLGRLDTLRDPGSWSGGNRATPWDRRWAYVEDWNMRIGKRGFLVDLRSRQLVDTGSFAIPARYLELHDHQGIARLSKGSVQFYDHELRPLRQVALPDSTSKLIFPAGDRLIVLDRLRKHHRVDVVDLKTLKLDSIAIPGDAIPDEPMSTMTTVTPSVWLNELGTLFLALGKTWDERIVYVLERNGHIMKKSFGSSYVTFDRGDEHGMRMTSRARVTRFEDGRIYTGSDRSSDWTYDYGSHALKPKLIADPDEFSLVGPAGNQTSLQRGGVDFLSLDPASAKLICGGSLFTNARITNYERFPLYGKEVIRIVRNEKRFGEFWKHIDVEPLVKRALDQ